MSWGSNSCYPVPWRNGWHCEQNMQVCTPDELKDWNPKLHQLIMFYGECFDDEWWYYLSRHNLYIKRVPVQRTQKKIFSEKPKRYDPTLKLDFVFKLAEVEKMDKTRILSKETEN